MTLFQLKMEDTIIEQVSDFNLLGLTINQHLNWKSHIDKISNKISRNIGILNKFKHILPLNTGINLKTGCTWWEVAKCSLLWKIKVMWKLLVINNTKSGYNCDRVSAPNVGRILFECSIVDTIRKEQ